LGQSKSHPPLQTFDIKQLLALVFALDQAYSELSKENFIYISLQIETVRGLGVRENKLQNGKMLLSSGH